MDFPKDFTQNEIVFRLYTIIFLFFGAVPLTAASSKVEIDWDSSKWQMGITAQKAPLSTVLGEIQRATDWEILMESGIDRPVTVNMRKRDVTDCLKHLLQPLRFELKRMPGAPTQLAVYRRGIESADAPVPETVPEPKKIMTELVISVRSESEAQRLARQFNADLADFVKLIGAARLIFRDGDQAASARVGLAGQVRYVDDVYEYPRPRSPVLVAGGVLPVRVKPTVKMGDDSLVIALVDTGVQSEYMDKPQFILEGKSVKEDAGKPSRAPLHGTAMASVMLRGLSNKDLDVNESNVRIQPIDVFGGQNNRTTSYDVAAGIAMAIESGADIINLSLGGPTSTHVVKQVLQEGHRRGILIIGAAGNEPVTAPTYPAAFSEVMAVTATDLKGNLASYANRGNFVDVAEIGRQPVRYNGRTYAINGTSPATAYISGMAAALMSKYDKSVLETREMIIKNRPFVPPNE